MRFALRISALLCAPALFPAPAFAARYYSKLKFPRGAFGLRFTPGPAGDVAETFRLQPHEFLNVNPFTHQFGIGPDPTHTFHAVALTDGRGELHGVDPRHLDESVGRLRRYGIRVKLVHPEPKVSGLYRIPGAHAAFTDLFADPASTPIHKLGDINGITWRDGKPVLLIIGKDRRLQKVELPALWIGQYGVDAKHQIAPGATLREVVDQAYLPTPDPTLLDVYASEVIGRP
jgi:hypothetical protein